MSPTNLLNKIRPLGPRPVVRFDRRDVLLALGMGLVAVIVSILCMRAISPLMQIMGDDVWYDADPIRVFYAMRDRLSEAQIRSSVHPLFSIFSLPPTRLLIIAGIDRFAAVLVTIAGTAFLTAAMMTLAIRGLGLPRAATALFTLLMIASSSYLSYFGFVETYAFSGLTVAVMLLATVAASREQYWFWFLGSAASLSGTVTNWSLGLASLFFNLPLVRAILIGVAGFAAVLALATIQLYIFPHAQLFIIPAEISRETQAFSTATGDRAESYWSAASAIWSIWVGAIIANPAEVIRSSHQLILNNQPIALGPTPVAQIIAIIAWLTLLAIAVQAGWKDAVRRPILLSVLSFLLCQTVLHLMYGRLTFLYAAHHMPALILLSAFAWFSTRRRIVLALASVALVFGAYANAAQFQDASAKANVIIDGIAKAVSARSPK